jgi:citrate lyase subunit beta / citryl-CoA lyase
MVFRMKDHPLPVIRSFLFAPANEARKTRRLGGSGADAVVLDLEDAVADSEKISARADAVIALATINGPFRCVRVNPISTPFGAGDIAAVVCSDLQAIVLPKVEHSRDLEIVSELVAAAERSAGIAEGTIGLIPLVETARGVSNATDILASQDRILTVALGTGDLGTDLALPTIRGDLSSALHYGRARFVYDARANGHHGIIDGPHLNVRDLEDLRTDCLKGRELGFTGKVCIHPDQVPIANEVFSPNSKDVEFAREVVTAFEAAERDRSAAIEVGGVFIDYPILYKARRILTLADRIAAQNSRTRDDKDVNQHG